MQTTSTTTYRKTKTGEWVVCGPPSEVLAGRSITVSKRDGTLKEELVLRVGRQFETTAGPRVYGYLAKRARQARSCGEAHSGPCCTTGGNCSSFGSGRGCGAYCCDAL